MTMTPDNDMPQDERQMQPRCGTCERPHRPDLPCWNGAYRQRLCEQTYRAKGRMCAECRRHGIQKRAVTIDHIVARAYGGGDEQRNLEPLCKPHNAAKGSRVHLPLADPQPVAGNGQPISSRFK